MRGALHVPYITVNEPVHGLISLLGCAVKIVIVLVGEVGGKAIVINRIFGQPAKCGLTRLGRFRGGRFCWRDGERLGDDLDAVPRRQADDRLVGYEVLTVEMGGNSSAHVASLHQSRSVNQPDSRGALKSMFARLGKASSGSRRWHLATAASTGILPRE